MFPPRAPRRQEASGSEFSISSSNLGFRQTGVRGGGGKRGAAYEAGGSGQAFFRASLYFVVEMMGYHLFLLCAENYADLGKPAMDRHSIVCPWGLSHPATDSKYVAVERYGS
jgi:hypothetical protein